MTELYEPAGLNNTYVNCQPVTSAGPANGDESQIGGEECRVRTEGPVDLHRKVLPPPDQGQKALQTRRRGSLEWAAPGLSPAVDLEALVSSTPSLTHGGVDDSPQRSEPDTAIDVRDQIVTRAEILRGVEPGAALIKQLHPCEFEAGETIFAEGDPGDRVFIIGSGKVKISVRGPRGRENLLAIMGPSDIFGELAVLDPGPRTCTATAITDVQAVWLDRATLRARMAHRPVIAERLLQLLTRRLRHTDDKLVGLICRDVAGRVARQLLLLARRFGTREGDALRVVHELTQAEMAHSSAPTGHRSTKHCRIS